MWVLWITGVGIMRSHVKLLATEARSLVNWEKDAISIFLMLECLVVDLFLTSAVAQFLFQLDLVHKSIQDLMSWKVIIVRLLLTSGWLTGGCAGSWVAWLVYGGHPRRSGVCHAGCSMGHQLGQLFTFCGLSDPRKLAWAPAHDIKRSVLHGCSLRCLHFNLWSVWAVAM